MPVNKRLKYTHLNISFEIWFISESCSKPMGPTAGKGYLPITGSVV